MSPREEKQNTVEYRLISNKIRKRGEDEGVFKQTMLAGSTMNNDLVCVAMVIWIVLGA